MSERDDRYLWDKSGPVDPAVERLEAALGRYRYSTEFERRPLVLQRARRILQPWAVAAAVAIALGAAWWLSRRERPGYAVEGLAHVERALVGERVVTGVDDHAVLTIGTIGDVRVQPQSLLRVEDAGREHHRLFLERGEVRASILASPGLFQIGTPAGLSVDLGCEYDVRVDELGTTHVHVLTGRVAFEGADRRVVVPAGVECEATRAGGPGVPVRVRATARLRAAVRALEQAEEPRDEDLAALLDSEWRDESVSLWHLLLYARSERVRRAMFDALARLHPLPQAATEESILAGDAALVGEWEAIVSRDWRGL